MATAGADNEIKLWRVDRSIDGEVTVTHTETLTGHAKAVNCCRFSANGRALASAGDAGDVYVWREVDVGSTTVNSHGDVVGWKPMKTLRGHSDDALSVCWGPRETLASASVDNTTILWDCESGNGVVQLREHAHYVQGVSYDPRGEFIVSQSPDRTAQVYAVVGGGKPSAKSVKHVRAIKAINDTNERVDGGRMASIFHDDSMTSFFRRPAWSPDGSFVVFPAGVFKRPGAKRAMHTTYVYARGNFETPVMHLPGGETPSVCVRFNPVMFKRRKDAADPTTPSDLPYRVVFAVCSQDGVTIYDTDETEPIVYVAGIHCTSITDCAWSPDGGMLVVSSTDGFASVVAFDEGELGAPETNIPEHVKSLLASSRIGESVPDEVVVVAPAVPNPVAAGPGPTRIAPVRIAPTPM